MVHYSRHHLPGGTWFFTVNLRNRRSYLLTRHITALKRAISDAQRSQPFTIDALGSAPRTYALYLATPVLGAHHSR